MNKFGKIYPFRQVREVAEYHGIQKMTYRAKVKLHGTNAGIRIVSQRLFPQSRSRVLTPKEDNYGFAAWVLQHRDYFAELPNGTLYGEWFGQGIQSKVAASRVKGKHFAPFQFRFPNGTCVNEPQILMPLLEMPLTCHPLPWLGDAFVVDFRNPDLAKAEALMAQVEAVDPFIRDTFGIEGLGEGIVCYPTNGMFDLMFKVKGKEHRVQRHEKTNRIQLTPEVQTSITAFVDRYVTPARLEQGFGLFGGDIRNTGKFIGWVCKDVKEESGDEIGNLPWKQVSKEIARRARAFYIDGTT